MTTKSSPPAIPSLETGTPPREWSASVLASGHATDTPATFAETETNARTGDPTITEETSPTEPRASKTLATPPDKLRSDSESTPVTMHPDREADPPSAVQTAATQDVPEQVSLGTPANYAAQIAASYGYGPDSDLQGVHWQQESVSSYLTNEERLEKLHVSLPSTELKGARPAESSGGVGALPGNLSESSVALLPDERDKRDQESRSTALRQRRDTIKPSTAGGDREPEVSGKEEVVMPTGTDATLSKDQHPVASQLSDRPFKNTEAGVQTSANNLAATSVGPEAESQKEVGETRGQQVQSEQRKVDGAPSADELGEQRSKLGVEETDQQKGVSQDVQEERGKEGKHAHAKVLPGYSGDYHPAQLHPPPPGASVAESQISLGGQQAPGADSPTTKTDRRALPEGAEKKPGFITMVKGEMKILAGKVSGDEQKVELGRKIIHGEA